MKKLSIFFASMVAVLGFTSCEEDTDPVYHAPTTFELNTPALQDQYIELTPTGTIDLVAKAQPNYGYSAITNYGCILSLTPDFTETRELTATAPTQSKMTFKSSDIAVAICELKGIETEEDYVEEDPITIYFKGVAEIAGIEGSRIVSSNYVSLNKVKYYFAVPVPGYIYLVGSPEGWAGPTEGNAAHYADWRLFEADDAIGSQIYTGVFDMPAAPMFRFYTALTGWDADSYGSQVDDTPVDVELQDGVLETPLVKGKGAFNFPSFTGGKMTIVVNMAEMTLQVFEGEQEVVTPQYIYMVGNNAGWKEPSEANASVYNGWRLVDNSNSGVYAGTFDLTDLEVEDLYCRFYAALAGWGPAQWAGAVKDGDNVEVTLGAVTSTVAGEGCFQLNGAKGSTITVTLDTNANTVKFE